MMNEVHHALWNGAFLFHHTLDEWMVPKVYYVNSVQRGSDANDK